MDAARQLAELVEPLGELGPGPRTGRSRAAAGSFSSFAPTMRRSSATDTSRCCAPSCRLRSSRRRSASPASTMRARDAASCSWASAFASACATSSAKSYRRCSRRPGAGGRPGRRGERAPEPPADADRGRHRGAVAGALQLLGERSARVRVLRALRAAAAQHLRDDGVAVQLDRAHRRAVAAAVVAPAAHDRCRAGARRSARRSPPARPAAARPPWSPARTRGSACRAGDERGDPAQRGLLVGERALGSPRCRRPPPRACARRSRPRGRAT